MFILTWILYMLRYMSPFLFCKPQKLHTLPVADKIDSAWASEQERTSSGQVPVGKACPMLALGQPWETVRTDCKWSFRFVYLDARRQACSLISANIVTLHKLFILQDLTCECVFQKVMKALSGSAAEMTVVTVPAHRAKFSNVGPPCSSKH